MYFLGFLIVLVFLGLNSFLKTEKTNKKCKQLEDQGAFLPDSGIRRNIISQDIWRDWYGERALFPIEYWPYLERNETALSYYIRGLIAKKEIEEGFKPSWCMGIYNKNTFVPMGYFHNGYDEKIKIYNETGKYYR